MSEAAPSAAPGAAAGDDRAQRLVLVDPCHPDRGCESEAVSVVIACRDRLVRAGLNAVLNLEADIVVLGTSADALANTSAIRVLTLGGTGQHNEVSTPLRPGARGLLLDETEPAELVRGVQAIATGEAVVSAAVAGQVSADSLGNYVRAVLYNGLGRYDDALAAARHATEYPDDLAFFTWGLVELIEAGARSGNVKLAADALDRLSRTTTSSGTDLTHGVEARSQALLSEGEAAEKLYRQAIKRLAPTRAPMEVARAHLLYGEWLRRQRRRLDARQQLQHAYKLFTEFGMEAFAERARIELQATGEHARKRTVETRDSLTPQEAQISRLAAAGATNQEIGTQLFISPSTVDYHLRKAFRKLGVRSRHQLEQHVL